MKDAAGSHLRPPSLAGRRASKYSHDRCCRNVLSPFDWPTRFGVMLRVPPIARHKRTPHPPDSRAGASSAVPPHPLFETPTCHRRTLIFSDDLTRPLSNCELHLAAGPAAPADISGRSAGNGPLTPSPFSLHLSVARQPLTVSLVRSSRRRLPGSPCAGGSGCRGG